MDRTNKLGQVNPPTLKSSSFMLFVNLVINHIVIYISSIITIKCKHLTQTLTKEGALIKKTYLNLSLT
ncbi:hypothetical protein Hanom_Chr09g00769061 [Helianthus anomalus]